MATLRYRSILRYVFTVALCLATFVNTAEATETDRDGRLYEASADALGDVEQALERAAGNNRLLLVVLGANWCHDSRALAARLKRPPLASVIAEHYELAMVDVGYLDKGRPVTQRFDVPHFYATPTVLIVDPSTEMLVNAGDRHQWGSAYNIDMEASVQYFEKWPTNDSVAMPDSPELRRLLDDVRAFEQRMAERVANGYAVVGPMLAAVKDGNKPEQFDARWNELRDFRVAVANDVQAIRDDVRLRLSAGEQEIDVDYPSYPPLTWESE